MATPTSAAKQFKKTRFDLVKGKQIIQCTEVHFNKSINN